MCVNLWPILLPTPSKIPMCFETLLKDRCKGKDASKLRFVLE
jgi:hypothetical protein